MLDKNANEKTVSRLKWIDCVKFVAILAVLTDHTFGLVYTNNMIAYASYFSTGLFIMLSGITLMLTVVSGKHCDMRSQVKRILSIFGQYAVATAILQFYYLRTWDLKTYLNFVLNFSVAGHFYYLCFFFQLLIISPFLIGWCKYCSSFRFKYLLHILTVAALGVISAWCIKYTYILPLHGGGQYLFGATYIIPYYLGMVFMYEGCFKLTKKVRYLVLPVAVVAWVFWWYSMAKGKLPFDNTMLPYWGGGFNPPSVHFMVFSVITLFVVYTIFSLLEECPNRIVNKGVSVIARMGQDTLYIFMYHLMAKDILARTGWMDNAGNMQKWICYWGVMILLPILMAYLFKKIEKGVKSITNA